MVTRDQRMWYDVYIFNNLICYFEAKEKKKNNKVFIRRIG